MSKKIESWEEWFDTMGKALTQAIILTILGLFFVISCLPWLTLGSVDTTN